METTNNYILFNIICMFIFVQVFLGAPGVNSLCPEKCTCRAVNENTNELKVKCGGFPQSKITSVQEIDFGESRKDIVHL